MNILDIFLLRSILFTVHCIRYNTKILYFEFSRKKLVNDEPPEIRLYKPRLKLQK